MYDWIIQFMFFSSNSRQGTEVGFFCFKAGKKHINERNIVIYSVINEKKKYRIGGHMTYIDNKNKHGEMTRSLEMTYDTTK